MVSLQGFDASTVNPEGMEPIPAGEYTMAITSSEQKPTKANDGSWLLALKLQVIDGPHKGRIVFANLNLGNKSEAAKAIAKTELSQICHATGVMKPNDSSELHNKPMTVSVTCEKYGDRINNRASKYKAVGAKSETASVATEDTPW